jgi:mRNA interferase HigB
MLRRSTFLTHSRAFTKLFAIWTGPQDIKAAFGTRVDFLPRNPVIFDLGGNKYRLVAVVLFRRKAIYIRFIGTHTAYDRIDAKTV